MIFSLMASTMLCLAACGGSDEPKPGPDPEPQPAGVVFFDDFTTFDKTAWTKETHPKGYVNNELQSYEYANVYTDVIDGVSVLVIEAKRNGSTFTSGRVNSKGKKSFKYGRFEARIKLPKTDAGLWPAFWMMGDTEIAWPGCGEIDIMEMGHKDGIAAGNSDRLLNSAIHWGTTVYNHEQEYISKAFGKNLQDNQFHTYCLEWTANGMTISVDGVKHATFSTADLTYFNGNKFYMLFNMAVGGDFPSIFESSGITALKDGQKAQMLIDWVRVTEL